MRRWRRSMTFAGCLSWRSMACRPRCFPSMSRVAAKSEGAVFAARDQVARRGGASPCQVGRRSRRGERDDEGATAEPGRAPRRQSAPSRRSRAKRDHAGAVLDAAERAAAVQPGVACRPPVPSRPPGPVAYWCANGAASNAPPAPKSSQPAEMRPPKAPQRDIAPRWHHGALEKSASHASNLAAPLRRPRPGV